MVQQLLESFEVSHLDDLAEDLGEVQQGRLLNLVHAVLGRVEAAEVLNHLLDALVDCKVVIATPNEHLEAQAGNEQVVLGIVSILHDRFHGHDGAINILRSQRLSLKQVNKNE